MKKHILASLILLFLCFSSHSSFAQTTIQSLTRVNTAACPASGVLPPHCQQHFAGQADYRSGIETHVFNHPAANVSNEDLHAYLQDGARTRVFANFMLAFCTSSGTSLCHGNVITGYTSATLETVGAQIEDLRSRHIDGAIMTWEGAGSTTDKSSLAYQAYVNAIHCNGAQTCDPSYFLMYDGPSLAYRSQATGIPGTTNQPCPASLGGSAYESCVVAHMKNDMCYMNGKHWGNDAYEKSSGRPVLQIFLSEDVIPRTGAAPSWTSVWQLLTEWNNDLPHNCRYAPYNADNGVPLVIFENAGGFAHEASSGSFYWIQPLTGIPNQMQDNIGPFQNGGTLEHFYQTAQAYQGKRTWGAAFKGFNDTKAPWGRNRIMDQRCGQTWVTSLKATSQAITGLAYPFLQVVTWNDYNEGTEIESGIDNCYTVSTEVAGNSLQWSLNPTNSYYASLSTVSHIEIYDSHDGFNLTLLAKLPAQTAGTYSLANLGAGQHHLFARMVGKNSIINRISPETSFTR